MTRMLTYLIAMTVVLALASCAVSPRVYPLCNMRCLPDGTCGTDHGVSAQEVDALTAALLAEHPFSRADRVAVTSGYALLMTSDATDANLRRGWGAAACFTPLSPSDNAKYVRFQQCLQGMPKWVQFTAPTSAQDLLLDPDFRKVCMGSTS